MEHLLVGSWDLRTRHNWACDPTYSLPNWALCRLPPYSVRLQAQLQVVTKPHEPPSSGLRWSNGYQGGAPCGFSVRGFFRFERLLRPTEVV